MSTEQSALLSIENLSICFGKKPDTNTPVVNDISFSVNRGEKLALVGESGSGKSVTALSILKLHDPDLTHYLNGHIHFEGQDLIGKSENEMRLIRGNDIAMIFQEPMTALNPVYTIGDQLVEPVMLHHRVSRQVARQRMIEMLDRTGIVDPDKRFDAYPHMLSGGQRQRVMIAMALACEPKLLIADEPTTALDVTIQVQIIELLEELQREFNMAVLMITHDLNMVKRFADRICVMQSGAIVETADTSSLFKTPQHTYTKNLLDSIPEKLVSPLQPEEENAESLLETQALSCIFPIKAGFFRRVVSEVRAVDDVSLNIQPGETLGIVGESGSGKTTLGMCLLRLQECQGRIQFNGSDLQALNGRNMRPLRRQIQVVFQDPFSSLSPRMLIEDILREGLKVHFPHLSREQHQQRILTILDEVGLTADMLQRYPHEFSGGQRQRIAIARAVVLEPKLIILDEPTSALDVSVQKQVLELLVKLQAKHKISYVFITHDLSVIQAMAHRIMVMRHGKVIEEGVTEELFARPKDEYTQNLLSASLFAKETA